MSNLLQIFLIICAIVFSAFVIRLLLKNKIGERNSVIWLAGTLLIFLIAGNPAIVDKVASIIGIDYPPSLLFLLSTLVLLLFNLYQTTQITRLSNKIKDISQHLALHHHVGEEIDGKKTEVGSEHEQTYDR
ncbi:MAG: hypothetical protein K0R71_1867 [Bacillales bacterium]|jgi:hypothetical protein|nr:hypothetical protein [Bacillales bacterium]